MMKKLLGTTLLLTLPIAIHAQVIHIKDASAPANGETLSVATSLPHTLLATEEPGSVQLAGGLFKERRELGKAYLFRLKTDNLLQNHRLEAGMSSYTSANDIHQGWELPGCQLRGHFLGHWLSAMAHFAATDKDPLAAARASEVVKELGQCQERNGGRWVGSIPEKYFDILAAGKVWIWSPQYTLHKTMMGLYDDYLYSGDKAALDIDSHSADWYTDWTAKMIHEGKSNVVYDGECAGMLELWADLYGATGDEKYLTLASRYAMPDLFRQLLEGKDALTNNHANASIPWIQGAARLYEVTGDERYRKIVEEFWRVGVEERGMYVTTGNNAGEFWVPSQQFARFLGDRTQEHCTVYNMIRVAQYLFRWTADAKYADYIERALYNGILAQQNPQTGMVAYFLPQKPGSKKTWGSETHDFWCCHGTMVQAQAMYEDYVFYSAEDGITLAQFIPSQAKLKVGNETVRVSQKVDPVGAPDSLTRTDTRSRMVVTLSVNSDASAKWTLRVRQPAWALGKGVVSVNGKPVEAQVSPKGFLEITREWKSDTIVVSFDKELKREPLCGDSSRFALLDGPIVLAAVSTTEPTLAKDADITPVYEHIYMNGRDWQYAHYLAHTPTGTVELKPLYEIVDEAYSLYFTEAK
jgi:DUF1680 family protein